MAFVRSKQNRDGTRSYSLVESYRDYSGRPRQRRLAFLGRHPTIDECIDAVADESVDRQETAKRLRHFYRHLEKMADELYPGHLRRRSPVLDEALGNCERAEAAHHKLTLRLGKLVRLRDDLQRRASARVVPCG